VRQPGNKAYNSRSTTERSEYLGRRKRLLSRSLLPPQERRAAARASEVKSELKGEANVSQKKIEPGEKQGIISARCCARGDFVSFRMTSLKEVAKVKITNAMVGRLMGRKEHAPMRNLTGHLADIVWHCMTFCKSPTSNTVRLE